MKTTSPFESALNNHDDHDKHDDRGSPREFEGQRQWYYAAGRTERR